MHGMKNYRSATLWVIVLLGFTAHTVGYSSDSSPIDALRAQANQGDPAAQYQLGVVYDQGRGVPRNPAEASAWYRKAADQGYAAAQHRLGVMYQFGAGVPQNGAEAVRWYQKAVDHGYVEAYVNLGLMYSGGLGVKQDKQKATNLFRSGAEKGDTRGMFHLAVSYWKGEGVSKDLVQAHMWLDLAHFYTQNSPNRELKWRIRGAMQDIVQEMTREQVKAAKKLAMEWEAAHRSQ